MVEERTPPYYRRNLAALLGDNIAFMVAMAFSNVSTVLPAFARELGASAPLVGLLSTLNSGGWLLPQLVAANYVGHKERKKPYIVLPALVGRPTFLILAILTYFWGATMPALVLAALYVTQAIFWISDGLVSVPWFDMLGKAAPGRLRGRFVATSQTISGLLSIGAGELVRRLLDPKTGPPFPQNYGTLFAIAGGLFMLSWFSLLFLKEPVESARPSERSSWKDYLPMLVTILRRDRPFTLAISARLLAGFAGMATPFFVLYGTEGLELGAAVVGISLTAQVIGRVIGGLLLGFWIERMGNRFTVLASLMVSLLMPALALALGVGKAALDKAALLYVYPIVFLLMGISISTTIWSFTNYLLDIAPPKDRPTYVGLTNTLSGLLLVAPMLGGALLEATSYGVLFLASAIIYALALAVAWRLPEGRRDSSASAAL